MASWRSAALVAVVFGAVGSIALLRHAQQHPPPVLVVLFVIWVIAPFALLGIANLVSKSWPATVRITLYIMTLFVAVASLAIYADDNIAHRTAKRAFVYVAVPPASAILSGIVLVIAAVKSRKGRSDQT